jgi:hypothetical protein
MCQSSRDNHRETFAGEYGKEFTAYLLISQWKGGITMAEKGKSKTDVSARADAKNRVQRCCYCGNKVEVVLSVSSSGKKKLRRLCCES